MTDRIRNDALLGKIMSAEQAALFIEDGMTIGCSGFAAIGYPKVVLQAFAERAKTDGSKINVIAGASMGDEGDGALARANAVSHKVPYMSNKDMRALANSNAMHYIDMHLSLVPFYVRNGYFGKVSVAVVEAIAITENGDLVLPLGVGATNVVVEAAEKVIVELNTSVPLELEGMHDIYAPEKAPFTQPIPIVKADDRVGSPYVKCGLDKIVAIVMTDKADGSKSMKAPDDETRAIAQNILTFLKGEMAAGRLPDPLPPMQSGVGNVANAVLDAFSRSGLKGLKMYSEVLQDSVIDLILTGTVTSASAAAFALSPESREKFYSNLDKLKGHLILRPQEISNSPEVIHRLGTIAMNTALEFDLSGNVNSSHVAGIRVMNGIGGSGDYTRNAGVCIFSTQSTAKGGTLSCVVPTVGHVDHTEHDTMIFITEQGIADLRGKDAYERAELIIENCAHPKFRPALRKYLEDAKAGHDKHALPPMPGYKLEAVED